MSKIWNVIKIVFSAIIAIYLLLQFTALVLVSLPVAIGIIWVKYLKKDISTKSFTYILFLGLALCGPWLLFLENTSIYLPAFLASFIDLNSIGELMGYIILGSVGGFLGLFVLVIFDLFKRIEGSKWVRIIGFKICSLMVVAIIMFGVSQFYKNFFGIFVFVGYFIILGIVCTGDPKTFFADNSKSEQYKK